MEGYGFTASLETRPSFQTVRFDDPRRQCALLIKIIFHSNPISASGDIRRIHQLPFEILQKIFTCVAGPRLPDTGHSLQVYPEWIAISYVCRHWRAAALDHHLLWGTITPNLSLPWIKTLMARSEPAQVDVDLRVGQVSTKQMFLSVDDAIALLSGCTRVHTLRLLGPRSDICAVLDALRLTTPIHSLTLSLWGSGPPVFISEDLFGGQAPIRRISFTANSYIVAPHWLLRGITHFTSEEQILLPDLLDALRQMPALTHFTIAHCRAHWEDTDASREPLIELTHLEEFLVDADSPHYFALLNQRLALPRNVKRQLKLCALAIIKWDPWLRWFDALLPVIEAANGLQHVSLSGGVRMGTFRLRSRNIATTYGDSEFSFEMYWKGSPSKTLVDQHRYYLSPIFHLGRLCDLLGATNCVRTLILEGDPMPTCVELPTFCWWKLLEKLPAVEELVLHANVTKVLCAAWEEDGAPAVLPASQRIHVVPDISTTIEERHVTPTIRKSLISRIVPSIVAKRPDSLTHTVVSVPSTNVPDGVVLSSTDLFDENLLDVLVKLLQGGSGPLNMV